MRKLSWISPYTHALIVKVMIAIFSGSLNTMQLHIMSDLGKTHKYLSLRAGFS